MAREFNGTSTDFITQGGAASTVLTASTASVSIWAKMAGSARSVAAVYSGDILWGDVSFFLGLFRADVGGSDRIWAYNWDGNEDRVGATYTTGVWTHFGWMHSGGNLSIYKDGELVSSVASGDTTNIGSAIHIGGKNAVENTWFEGALAEYAIWDVALTTAEWAMLGKAYSPLFVRPGSLTRYSPFVGRANPEPEYIQGQGGTATGTTTIRHPRVIYPTRRRAVHAEAMAGGIVVPRAMAQYRQRRSA